MQYFEEMLDKEGFRDGADTPAGAEAYRQVYLTAMNRLLEKRESGIRLIGYNRPGLHNRCMIVLCQEKDFRTLKEELAQADEYYVVAPVWFMTQLVTSNRLISEGDEKFEDVVDQAMSYCLDDFVEVKVTLDTDSLEDFLVNQLGDEE